jgi:formate dehydrogenase iron-sulfur subunit
VQKCKFCFERLEKGQRPACTSACPYGATVFGPRYELVAEAHARIKSQPDLYVPHVYGETDFGGTSVMYVTDVPLEDLGFPTKNVKDPNKSLPAYSHPVALQTPFLAAAVFGSLAGVTWIVNRRMELAKREQDKKDADY